MALVRMNQAIVVWKNAGNVSEKNSKEIHNQLCFDDALASGGWRGHFLQLDL